MELRGKIKKVLWTYYSSRKTHPNDNEAINEILALIKPQWISVEDRLPKEMERIITHHKRGAIRLHRWVNIDKEDFTHWMPLPQPPKE